MVADERGEELDLVGREAAQLRVLDEIRGVAMVTLARDVLADVVEEHRVLEHLAVVGAEAVQLLGLVEQLEREPRDVSRVLESDPHRRASPATAARRNARGSSDQSSGSWWPTASRMMPSRSAHSLIVIWSKSNTSIVDGEERGARDDELGPLLLEAGHAAAFGASARTMRSCTGRKSARRRW